MTCIVGGRGTGKSSIISLIRGILNKKPELDKIKKEFESFYVLNNKQKKEGVLKEGSCIELFINMNETNYKITKKGYEKGKEFYDIDVLERDKEGNYIKCETDGILDHFKIEIFSQKEIFEISNESNSLLEIIDISIDEIENKKDEIKNLKSKYKELYLKLENITQKESDIKKVATNIKLGEDRLQKIENKNYKSLLEAKKIFLKEEEEINNFYKKFQDVYDSIVCETKEEIEIEDEIIKQVSDNYLKLLNKNISDLKSIKEKIKLEKIEFQKYVEQSEWKRNYEKILTELAEEEANIEIEVGTLNISEIHENISINKKRLSDIEAEISEKKEMQNQLDETFEKILEVRNEIFNLRKTHLIDSLEGLDIEIKINKFRNKDSFENSFRKIIARDTEFTNDISDFIEETYNGEFLEGREKFIDKIYKIKKGEEILVDSRLKNIITGLNNENMAEINLLLPEDEIIVKIKQNGRLKNLKTVSAGQKTSAILTYILSKETNPLILDQPEDDLDNELIYNLIVESLKKVKTSRQIIVVTHNANIPVNGDAEYVVVMDSESKYIKQKSANSIDEKNIVDAICNIMEGGKSAFDFRNEKYKLSKL